MLFSSEVDLQRHTGDRMDSRISGYATDVMGYMANHITSRPPAKIEWN